MAIDKKSKMGSMMGMPNLNAIAETSAPTVQEEKPKKAAPKKSEPAQDPQAAHTAQTVAAASSKIYSGGKPKFELIAGAEEKKINFHFPKVLYDFICGEARKQEKSAKQFISEILLEEMGAKYGFKVE